MAELNFPDFLGTAQRGYAVGAGMRDDRRQQQDQEQIRALAPQIVGGDLAAYQQAAAVDPEAAQKLQGAGDVTFKRLAGAYKLVDDAKKTGDIRAVNAALKQTAPFFSQVLGKPVPTEWAVNDPAWEEGWGKLGQQIAMASQGAKQDRNAIVSPGSAVVDPQTGQVIYERPFAPQAQSFEFAGPDGRPRRYTFNTRTREYEEANLGGNPPAPTRFKTSSGEVIDISQVADPSLRQQIIANPAAFGMAPEGEALALPEVQKTGQGGLPLVGRAPEEQAALTTAAQEQAKLAVLAEQERIKRDSAIQEAAGKAEEEARIKREADLATAAQKKYVDANTTISLLDQAEQLIGKSTGSRLGAARDAAAATFGVSTEGAQAIAQLQPIAAALTLAVPRMEGPQSDADRMLYQKAAGDFANPEVPTETRLAALQQMRVLAQKYVNTGGRAAPAPKTYTVGQTVEHNGKVYRVVGGDPADPDLEEVR